MPCPAGINIPAAFSNLNEYHMYSKAGARLHHAMHLGIQTDDGKPHWTTDCIDCGACEEKCPQNIPVRQVFKQVQNDLEGPSTKALAGVARMVLGTKHRKKRGEEA